MSSGASAGEPAGSANRTQRRRERHRQQMLDTAEQLLAARPFEAVRIDDVAEQADVAVGTVYAHFGNKDGLILSVAERMLSRAADYTDAAIASTDDPVGRLAAYGAACLDLLIDFPTLARLLLMPTSPTGSDIQTRLQVGVKQFYDKLAGVIREGTTSGDLIAVDADDLATFLISAWCGVVIATNSPLTPPADSAGARTTIQQATGVMLRGLLNPR